MAHPRQRARNWAHWAIVGSFLPAGIWYFGLDFIWDRATFTAARSNDPAQMTEAVTQSIVRTQLLNALTLPIAFLFFLGGVGILIALRLTRPPPHPPYRSDEVIEEEEEEEEEEV